MPVAVPGKLNSEKEGQVWPPGQSLLTLPLDNKWPVLIQFALKKKKLVIAIYKTLYFY